MDHDATIAVYYPDGIGQLIDLLLFERNLKLTGFEWLPFGVNRVEGRRRIRRMRLLGRGLKRGRSCVREWG